MASTQKFTPSQWQENNRRIVDTARTSRRKSLEIRDESLNLRNVTSSHLTRTNRDVQNKLSLRVDDIHDARRDLERQISETFSETGRQIGHNDLLGSDIQAKELPLNIAKECLEFRSQRTGIDLVRDDVEIELEKEVNLIEHVVKVLESKKDSSTEQIRLLRAAHYQLEQDLRDKFTASSIDEDCQSLQNTSRSISNHHESVQIPSTSVLPDDWTGFTNKNISRALSEQKNSEALREDIDLALKQTADAMLQQMNAVENAFNARIAETQDAKNLANQQLVKTNGEIEVLERTIKELEDDIRAQEAPLQVAETRLDKRLIRPNVELVRDDPQYGLITEVNEINKAMDQLRDQLDVAEDNLRALNRIRLTLEEEINVKTNSLNIDNRCMQRRQQYKYRVTN